MKDALLTLTREQVKKMIREDKWKELGAIFGFTPIYHEGMGHFLDWRCVPQVLISMLGTKPSHPSPKLKANGEPIEPHSQRVMFPPSDRVSSRPEKLCYNGFF